MKSLFTLVLLFVSSFIYSQDIKLTSLSNNSLPSLNTTNSSSFRVLPSKNSSVNMLAAEEHKKQFKIQKIKKEFPKIKMTISKKQQNINTVYKESKGGPYYIPGAFGNGVCIPRF